MKMLVVGDTHGDLRFARACVEFAAAQGITRIHQVGDFGIWPGKSGKQFRDKLDESLQEHGVVLSFTDGNHEDFDYLDTVKYNAHTDDNGMYKVRENIRWADRGLIWTEGPTSFMSMGGAVSVDKEWRTPRKSWWHQEAIREGQVERALTNHKEFQAKHGKRLDVLFTHDSVNAVTNMMKRLKVDPDSEINRQLLTRVVNGVNPRLMVHGHYHQTMDYWHRDTRVVGLSCNDDAIWTGAPVADRWNATILELPSLKTTNVRPMWAPGHNVDNG